MNYTYHAIPPAVVTQFETEHAQLSGRLEEFLKNHPKEKRLDRLAQNFKRTAGALHKHRYSVIHWKEGLEKSEQYFQDMPEVVSLVKAMQRLLTIVIRATVKQN